MDSLGEFGCRDCSMVFHSFALLEKHKSLFCIGSDIGDPVALRQRQEHIVRDGGRGLQPRQTWTPNLVRPRGQRIHHQRNFRWRFSDAEPKRDRAEVNPATSAPENLALRNLTDEFHKLRTSIEGSLSHWPKWTACTEKRIMYNETVYRVLLAPQTHSSLSSRGSSKRSRLFSVLAPQVSGPCTAPAAERLRKMNEVHERQLAQIQAHNQQLELQREDLARQLGALAGHSDHGHLETLLMELKEQEERNQGTLQQLAEQLNTLRTGPQVKEVSDLQNPGSNQEEDMKRHHVTFDLISSINGPLSAQIKAVRLAYMQGGGCDPAVLAQMHDLQAEAQTLEQNQPGAGAKSKRKKLGPAQRSRGWEVQAVEQENLRLEEEILRRLLARERQCGQEEAAVGAGFQLIQRDHLHHMASMQAEVESLRREMERTRGAPRKGRQPPPPPFPTHHPALHPLAYIHAPPALRQPRPQSSRLERHLLEPLVSLGPAPYDPMSGFVIFYDLVLGVDATLSVLRLVAALYSGGQELGRPTLLPPVQCQPGGAVSPTRLVPPGNYALLSAKQPVTRMQPSPSLSLLVEVQAVGGVDVYGQEVQRLVSRGWARLELFDQHNQVQSGHWRAPFRCLPVRPSLSPAQLNALPQVGSMELCVRLVNARDGDIQTLAEPVPSDSSQYKYPAVVPVYPVSLQGNPTLQPTAANQLLSLLPDADHEDPPPTEGTSHR